MVARVPPTHKTAGFQPDGLFVGDLRNGSEAHSWIVREKNTHKQHDGSKPSCCVWAAPITAALISFFQQPRDAGDTAAETAALRGEIAPGAGVALVSVIDS